MRMSMAMAASSGVVARWAVVVRTPRVMLSQVDPAMARLRGIGRERRRLGWRRGLGLNLAGRRGARRLLRRGRRAEKRKCQRRAGKDDKPHDDPSPLPGRCVPKATRE